MSKAEIVIELAGQCHPESRLPGRTSGLSVALNNYTFRYTNEPFTTAAAWLQHLPERGGGE